MRYPASEKAEIIQLVEQSHLPTKRICQPSARWTSSAFHAPPSIAGMSAIVKAGGRVRQVSRVSPRRFRRPIGSIPL